MSRAFLLDFGFFVEILFLITFPGDVVGYVLEVVHIADRNKFA